MPNSYSQLYVHLIFSVKYRQCLIHRIESDLYRYITGVIQSPKNNSLLIAIGGMPDHVHILTRVHPTISVSNLIKDIKIASTLWINNHDFYMGKFHWQDGYGAFTLGESQIAHAIQYIQNQKEHHKSLSFHDEMVWFMKRYNIQFDERYIPEPIDKIE